MNFEEIMKILKIDQEDDQMMQITKPDDQDPITSFSDSDTDQDVDYDFIEYAEAPTYEFYDEIPERVVGLSDLYFYKEDIKDDKNLMVRVRTCIKARRNNNALIYCFGDVTKYRMLCDEKYSGNGTIDMKHISVFIDFVRDMVESIIVSLDVYDDAEFRYNIEQSLIDSCIKLTAYFKPINMGSNIYDLLFYCNKKDE